MSSSLIFAGVFALVGLANLVRGAQTTKFYMTVQPARSQTSSQTVPAMGIGSNGEEVMMAVYPGLFKSSYYANGFMSLPTPTIVNHVVSQIAISESGQTFAFVDHFGVYLSPMYGDYWYTVTPVTGVDNLDWAFIGCSHDAFIMLTAATTGAVYWSHNQGNNWTAVTNTAITNGIISSLAVSFGGMYMVITQDSSTTGLVWISADAGVTWNSVSTTYLPVGCYNNAQVSYSGQYITVTKCGTTIMYQSQDYGATWGRSAPKLAWASIQSSASGQYVVASSLYDSATGTASQIWVSNTKGYFWRPALTSSSSSVSYTSVAISNSGQYMIAGTTNGWIVYSTDYGLTWSTADTSSGTYSSYSVPSVSCSSSCLPAYAAVPGVGIFSTSNYGATWTLVYSSSLTWASVATGGGGVSVVAAATTTGSMSTGYVYDSNNGGRTWMVTTVVSGSSVSTTSNAFGTSFVVAASNATSSKVYLSTNNGFTFSEISTPSKTLIWNEVFMSGNGATIFLADKTGGVYNSTTSGASWTKLLQLSSVTSPVAIATPMGGVPVLVTPGGSVGYMNMYLTSIGWGVPYPETSLLSLSQASTTPSILIAGGMNNAYLSTTYGAFWYAATGLQGTNFALVKADYAGDLFYAFSMSAFKLYTTYSGLGLTMSPTAAPVPTVKPTAAPAASTLPLTLYEGTLFSDFTGTKAVVASSTSGATVIVAGSSGVYVSSNYGANFNRVNSSVVGSFRSISVNGTGDLVALLSTTNLYISSNMGATWKVVAKPNGYVYSDVAVSVTGQVVLACQYKGNVFFSTDAGTTFTSALSPLNATTAYWSTVALSGNGKYMLVGTQNHTSPVGAKSWGTAYYSSNYGATWTIISSTTVPHSNVYGSFVSSTGQNMYLTGDNGLYQSVNYGVTWTYVTPSYANQMYYMYEGILQFAAAPMNRLFMMAAFGTNDILVSGNGGFYWYVPTIVNTDDDSTHAWSAVAVNSQGTIMYAFDVSNNRLYSTSTLILAAVPTATPSVKPTTAPIANPSAAPTFAPTFTPTALPTATPTFTPSAEPTQSPTVLPTALPSAEPTATPSFEPTFEPTPAPTFEPTFEPSAAPSFEPTDGPTAVPSLQPTDGPTANPTMAPVANPTHEPTNAPVANPTASPIAAPTPAPGEPTADPTPAPTEAPTEVPTMTPTVTPSCDVTLYEGWSIGSAFETPRLVSSDSGEVIVAVSSAIFGVSTNFGVSWTLYPNITSSSISNVAMSGSGDVIVLSARNSLFVSTDFGASFSERSIVDDSLLSGWTDVAVSSSGSHILACWEEGGLYHSSDGGNAFSLVAYSTGLPLFAFDDVEMSEDGQYMLATASEGVYVSQDYGATWNCAGMSGSDYVAQMSSTGDFMFVMDKNNLEMHVSTDYGATFGTQSLSVNGGVTLSEVSAFVIASNNPANQMMMATSSSTSDVTVLVSDTFGKFWNVPMISVSGTEYSADDTTLFSWSSIASDAAGVNLLALNANGNKLCTSNATVIGEQNLEHVTKVPTAAPSSGPAATDDSVSSAVIAGSVVGSVCGVAVIGAAAYYAVFVAHIGASGASAAAAGGGHAAGHAAAHIGAHVAENAV